MTESFILSYGLSAFLTLCWGNAIQCRLRNDAEKIGSPADQMQILERLHVSSEPSVAPGTKFVHLAKMWAARIYYSTKAGDMELNTGGRVPASYDVMCRD